MGRIVDVTKKLKLFVTFSIGFETQPTVGPKIIIHDNQVSLFVPDFLPPFVSLLSPKY